MASFTVSMKINASRERVWDTLADIGSIYKWNPGVSHSYTTSELESGEGTLRRCDLQDNSGKNMGYVKEKAFDWKDGRGFKIDAYESNLPLKSSIVEFGVEEAGDETIVTLTPTYAIKYGPVGAILDMLMYRRLYKKGMEGLLAGLKHYIETGEEVGSTVPAKAGVTS